MNFEDDNPLLFAPMNATKPIENVGGVVESWALKVSEDELRTLSDEEITRRLLEERTVQPLVLHRDTLGIMNRWAVLADQKGNWFHINDPMPPPGLERGIRVRFSIRYSGLSNLWRYRPASGWESDARANVSETSDNDGSLEIALTAIGEHAEDQIRSQLDTQLSLIEAGVDALRPVIEEWNHKISEQVLDAVRRHRQHLKIVEELPERLKIPLIVRNGRADYRPIAIVPRQAEPVKMPAVKDESEYFIGHPEYEMILNIIRHFGRSFEVSPKALQTLREPDIRDLYVAALNAYFSGRATAEQFRRRGKADVTIEEKTRAAFIAEFKMWNGEKSVHEALDQILDYTTWRDAKCAVVLFNRRAKDFLAVLKAIAAHLGTYPFVRSNVQEVDRGEWRIVISPRGAPGHQIAVHVFAFDIRTRLPAAKQRK